MYRILVTGLYVMKRILFNIFCLFSFILVSAIPCFSAGYISFSSVSYDNSSAFLTLNSFDNEEYTFDTKPILNFDGENSVYFDIMNSVLNCPNKDLIVKSHNINEIIVSQESRDPQVVRVRINYNSGFNPKNISLKKVGNTIFVNFAKTVVSNYYFQNAYTETKPAEIYETAEIQTKITSSSGDILGQINSAFNALSSSDKNFIISKNNIMLPSRYYADNISVKGNTPVLSGFGSYSVMKPFYLSEPNRAVFDIPNAIVNQTLHNRDIPFANGDSIKIAQFDRNTARVVITSNSADKYMPVIFSDTQKVAFVDVKNQNVVPLFTSSIALKGVQYEKNDASTASSKFLFSAPLIFGINRSSNNLNIYLMNVSDISGLNLSSELANTSFDKVKISSLKNSSYVLSFPAEQSDIFDIHIGADGKTLRIRQKFSGQNVVEEPKTNTPEVIIPIFQNRDKGKKYVFIDAGHGGTDCGAIREGINEKDITLDIAKRVEKILTKKGYVVAMSRDDDNTVSLQDRVNMSELFNPDVFVSIHVNSNINDSPHGIETHYYKDNSLHLAKCVHAALLNNVTAHDRGLFKSKFYVINHTTAPAILVEMGFLSNPQERAQLLSESRKAATAKAIAEGIDEYYK